jgi:predicted PurR-regulated permease PerM
LTVFFVIAFTGASLWILRPFVPALIWAVMIVIPTWGMLHALERRLWGKRALAAAVLTLLLVLIFVVPLSLAIGTIIANADTITGWVKSIESFELPPAPTWLDALPVVGTQISSAWNDAATHGAQALLQRTLPYAQVLLHWLIGQLGGVGVMTMQFLLVVILVPILYTSGERAADGVRRFAQRLAGATGERAVVLAGKAIQGVALGIVVTAFVQAVAGGVGLAIAGVPFAALLTAVMFFLAIVQVGAAPLLIMATIWLLWQGHQASGHCWWEASTTSCVPY